MTAPDASTSQYPSLHVSVITVLGYKISRAICVYYFVSLNRSIAFLSRREDERES